MAKLLNCIFKITSHVINLDDSGAPEDHVEKDEFSVAGTLKFKDGAALIAYKELREGSSVFCEITVNGDEVTVERSGDVMCKMLFSAGKTHKSIYKVSPFSFDMEISTVRIESTVEQAGGSLSLIYNMNIGGAEKRCRMKISRQD